MDMQTDGQTERRTDRRHYDDNNLWPKFDRSVTRDAFSILWVLDIFEIIDIRIVYNDIVYTVSVWRMIAEIQEFQMFIFLRIVVMETHFEGENFAILLVNWQL